MKILIVEDNIERRNWFKSEFKAYELTFAVNAEEGIKQVEWNKFDVIFLDHDLGGLVFVDSFKQNTGFQVAKAIVNSVNDKTPVIIHSWNPAGSENIKKILGKRAAYLPFGTFTNDLIKRRK